MRISNALSLLVIIMAMPTFVKNAEAQSRIDLVVDSVQVNPSRLSANPKVEVVAVIRNNGSEQVENVSLEVDILKEGKRVKAIKDIPVLAHLPRSGSGQGLPISVGALPVGSYEALVKVDPDNQIPETDEKNNEKKVKFDVSEPLA